ncbi:hypothetical protein PENSPDRAFT_647612 [Peniophora sp. CONT]|nr:hypothetical protein PENSPDRAFT_647612 [Peniophora sp. CONT]
MSPTTPSSVASILQCILGETRAFRLSLPEPQRRLSAHVDRSDPVLVYRLPEPQSITASLCELGCDPKAASIRASHFMQEALRLKDRYECILSRVVSEMANCPADSDNELIKQLTRVHALNYKRIVGQWALRIAIASPLPSNAPCHRLLKGVGPPATLPHGAGTNHSFIEECASEADELQLVTAEDVAISLVDKMLELSLGPQQITTIAPSPPLPTTATRHAIPGATGTPASAISPLRVIPQVAAEKDAFLRYATKPLATLAPKQRRRRMAGLPKRVPEASPSSTPSVTTLSPSSTASLINTATTTPVSSPLPAALPAPPQSMGLAARRRRVAPLPVRSVERECVRDVLPKPSPIMSGSSSPTTPTFASRRSVSRTPSLTSMSSDDDSSSTGPSTPGSSVIELPTLTSPLVRSSFLGDHNAPAASTDKTTTTFASQPNTSFPRGMPMSSAFALRVTTPGTFVQPYGADLTPRGTAKTGAPLQASAPKARRVAGLPGTKRALNGASPSTPKVFGLAAPCLPTAAPEVALGTFDVPTPRAGASFNFSYAQ